MKIPKPGSMREKVILHVLEHGKRTREQIAEAFPQHSRASMTETLYRLSGAGGPLEVRNDVYSVEPKVAKHYSQSGEPVKPAYVGEIVPSRTAPAFKPLKALPWARHMDKIRTDVSFKNGGTLFTFGWAV